MLHASKNTKKESVTRLGLTRNRTGVAGMLLKKIRIRSANPYTIKPCFEALMEGLLLCSYCILHKTVTVMVVVAVVE
jgi:hypothetical protein